MTDQSTDLLQAKPDTSWVRLRTLIALRWVAIAGQFVAITVAQRLFSLDIDLGLSALAVGLLITANIVFYFVYPENKRLNEREATLMMLFDTVQLSLLLYLTGGLHNPFAILMVAPVTVAATALSLRSTLIIGATAVALVSLVAQYHVPLRTMMGYTMQMPDVFVTGFWVALVITLAFLAFYARRIATERLSMSQALLATQMALAREQKLTDLGGVVAAAAHEMGTPLATITLVSSELAEELDDQPEQRDDAVLIREQADRCRDILRSMGRAGKDDMHLRQALLSALVDEAAEPHLERGKALHLDVGGESINPFSQPLIERRPEIVHGLRNLIQNAVDFAASTVWIETSWTDDSMSVRITDDGAGYPPHLIGRLGDPFMRRRRTAQEKRQRPEYEGMGLGLFIAKTLLERTGADLTFANGTDPFTGIARPGERSGAVVHVAWNRGPGGIEVRDKSPALGENIPFTA